MFTQSYSLVDSFSYPGRLHGAGFTAGAAHPKGYIELDRS
jgi:hypothetical protein